jgi:DNA invertase Pin-like site-specific DNA recombinase
MTTTDKTKALRVGVYARVSSSDQNSKLQIDEIREAAHQRNWKIIGEFIDDGVSGSLKARPALDRMMAEARAGRIQAVVTWRLDRLGRSLSNLLELLDELASLHVGFVSIKDTGIDTTSPQGRLMIALIGAFAEFERQVIRERVVSGIRLAQKSGVHCGRPRKSFDITPVLALFNEGHGLKSASRLMGLSRSTLRRHLRADGRWPKGGGSERSSVKGTRKRGPQGGP